MQWREWSGYFAASAYADAPDVEYNAIREAVALIDVSPLFKYLVTGPGAVAALPGPPGVRTPSASFRSLHRNR